MKWTIPLYNIPCRKCKNASENLYLEVQMTDFLRRILNATLNGCEKEIRSFIDLDKCPHFEETGVP